LILDTTKSGIASETVKSFTQALGLPTISASYGQEGDLRQWRDLDEAKQKYLLQVMPPADIIPEVIRSLVTHLNITNGKRIFKLFLIYKNIFKLWIIKNFLLPFKYSIT